MKFPSCLFTFSRIIPVLFCLVPKADSSFVFVQFLLRHNWHIMSISAVQNNDSVFVYIAKWSLTIVKLVNIHYRTYLQFFLFFLMIRTFKIFLSNFQIYSTVVTMLYVASLGLNHFTTGILYLLTHFAPYPCNHPSVFHIYDLGVLSLLVFLLSFLFFILFYYFVVVVLF